MPLIQGQIVRLWVKGQQDDSEKCRPVVILTPTDEIKSATTLAGVAATTTFHEPLEVRCVRLPWHRQGQVRTKLRSPTVAVCDWFVSFAHDEVEEILGVVPPMELVEILKKVNEAKAI